MIGLGIAALLAAGVLALHDNTAESRSSAPAPAASSPASLSTSVALRVPTATPAPPGSMPTVNAPRSLSLPTVSSAEQVAASHTRLYLTAFQNQNVSVIDPPSGHALHGVYPMGSTGCFESLANDLALYVWETATGHLVKQVQLSDQVSVPSETCGRGGRVYFTISPDGTDLFLAWEDRLWEISSKSLRVTVEFKLPSAVDGIALSLDGREFYLLPSTMGDLTVLERGMWIVDTTGLSTVRHASDWPQLMEPFMFSAPATR